MTTLLKTLGQLLIGLFLCAHTYADFKQPVSHWNTKNGAGVYYYYSAALPIVDINTVFNSGVYAEDTLWGINTLTTSLLDQGTKKHSAQDIASIFSHAGAQFTTSADKDKTIVHLRSLLYTDAFEPALDNYIDILSNPSFNKESIALIKQLQITAIKAREQKPQGVASNAFYKALYKQSPYGHPTLGTKETITPLTQDQIKSFYNTFFVASNAKIIILGAVSKEQAKTIAEKISMSLKTGKPIAKSKNQPATDQPQSINITFPAQQATIMLGHIGITRHNPDYFPLMVANTTLGTMPLNNELFNVIRNDEGLAYSTYSYFNPLQYRGPFTVFLQTNNNQKERAIKKTQAVLNNFVKKGLTANQLHNAKKYLTGSFPIALASNQSILTAVTNIAFYNRPLDYLNTYRKNIEAVTLQQVNLAIKKNIHPDEMITVTVGKNTG